VDRVGLSPAQFGQIVPFHSLTAATPYRLPPFSTVETEVGVAHVPDPGSMRLEMSRPQIVYAASSRRHAAIAKAVKGDALGGRFLAGVRELTRCACPTQFRG